MGYNLIIWILIIQYPFTGLFSKIKSQGLIDCLELGMELLSMEVEGVEGVLIPVLGWVAIVSVVVLLLGGVGLGIYIRSRYSNVTIK